MIGYLIKPLERTLQRVQIDDYKSIYKAGGYDCFDCVVFNDKQDTVYVSDDALLKPIDPNNFFFIQGTAHPLCGNGVVLGCDREGESTDPQVSFEDFAKLVTQATLLNPLGPTFVHEPLRIIEDILTLEGARPRGWRSVDPTPPEAGEF